MATGTFTKVTGVHNLSVTAHRHVIVACGASAACRDTESQEMKARTTWTLDKVMGIHSLSVTTRGRVMVAYGATATCRETEDIPKGYVKRKKCDCNNESDLPVKSRRSSPTAEGCPAARYTRRGG